MMERVEVVKSIGKSVSSGRFGSLPKVRHGQLSPLNGRPPKMRIVRSPLPRTPIDSPRGSLFEEQGASRKGLNETRTGSAGKFRISIEKHRKSIIDKFNKDNEISIISSTVRTKGNIPDSRASAHLLAFGTDIFLYGGERSDITNDLYKLDYSKMVWQSLASHEVSDAPRLLQGQSTVAYKNFIVVYGGYERFDNELKIRRCSSLVYFYDTIFLSWKSFKTIGCTPVPRRSHAATQVGDTMVVYSGLDFHSEFIEGLEVLDLKNMSWCHFHTTGDLPTPLIKCSLTAIYSPSLKSLPGFNVFQTIGQQDSVFTNLTSGIYLFGGLSRSSSASSELYLIRSKANKQSSFSLNCVRIEAEGNIPIARYDHSACSIGKHFIVYGGRNNSINGEIIGEVSIMKVTIWRWEVVKIYGNTPGSRAAAACVAIERAVLIFGGVDNRGFVSAEIFKLETEQKTGQEISNKER